MMDLRYHWGFHIFMVGAFLISKVFLTSNFDVLSFGLSQMWAKKLGADNKRSAKNFLDHHRHGLCAQGLVLLVKCSVVPSSDSCGYRPGIVGLMPEYVPCCIPP